MARGGSRAGGHVIPPMPVSRPEARPASPSDPANGQAHPTSRKPNAPGAGGGHGGGSNK